MAGVNPVGVAAVKPLFPRILSYGMGVEVEDGWVDEDGWVVLEDVWLGDWLLPTAFKLSSFT